MARNDERRAGRIVRHCDSRRGRQHEQTPEAERSVLRKNEVDEVETNDMRTREQVRRSDRPRTKDEPADDSPDRLEEFLQSLHEDHRTFVDPSPEH